MRRRKQKKQHHHRVLQRRCSESTFSTFPQTHHSRAPSLVRQYGEQGEVSTLLLCDCDENVKNVLSRGSGGSFNLLEFGQPSTTRPNLTRQTFLGGEPVGLVSHRRAGQVKGGRSDECGLLSTRCRLFCRRRGAFVAGNAMPGRRVLQHYDPTGEANLRKTFEFLMTEGHGNVSRE